MTDKEIEMQRREVRTLREIVRALEDRIDIKEWRIHNQQVEIDELKAARDSLETKLQKTTAQLAVRDHTVKQQGAHIDRLERELRDEREAHHHV